MIRAITLKFLATVAFLVLVATVSSALAQTAGPPDPIATFTLVPPNHVVLGDVAAEIIQWALAAFGTTISSAVLWLVVRLLKAAGLKNTDLLKDQLQRIVVNGVNAGAARAMEELRGHGQVDVKGVAARYALWYVQTHASGIIRSLGLDPQDGEAVEAIRARIETAIADPNSPTNPIVTPRVVTEQSTRPR